MLDHRAECAPSLTGSVVSCVNLWWVNLFGVSLSHGLPVSPDGVTSSLGALDSLSLWGGMQAVCALHVHKGGRHRVLRAGPRGPLLLMMLAAPRGNPGAPCSLCCCPGRTPCYCRKAGRRYVLGLLMRRRVSCSPSHQLRPGQVVLAPE